ncbi:type II secretion system F family protein [Robiginitomaculum antarcticum]|uniref:type II secretion system F family protein n=1 Tax=Robiginitomaculum antarcticum TaxID=437507 RepID=UPI0003A06B85|nr:type II secretion system F family protein [Robiginitomaculum antarcticum]
MQAVIGGGRQAVVKVRLANARLKKLEADETRILVVEKMRKSRSLNADGDLDAVNRWLNTLVLQSGAPLGKGGIYVIMGGLSVALPAIFFTLTQNYYYALAGLALGALGPIFGLKVLVKRRRAKIGSQLPEALDVIVRSLSAGHPVPVAMNMVGREMPDPIGSEFGMTNDEISFGASLGEGIQRMAERVGHADFDLFAATVRLQERTGSNLADLLRANSKTIRDRQRMRLKIKAASAEGRMSAMILNLAPLLLYISIRLVAPNFYGEVADNPMLNYGLGAAVIWMIIGNLVMRKMIAFRI